MIMRAKMILFIVEGPSDHYALIPYIEDKFTQQKIKVTVDEIHGDILTEYIENTRIYKVNKNNVKKELVDRIKQYFNTQDVKSQNIKAKDIIAIYYITDTDYCFSQNTSSFLNKKECLMKMFNFDNLELIKDRIVPFKVIFLSKHLEHIINGTEENLSALEKEKIAVNFGDRSRKEDNFYENTFRNEDIKTWKSFKESYQGIVTYVGRASNMNNLLDEIEKNIKKLP